MRELVARSSPMCVRKLNHSRYRSGRLRPTQADHLDIRLVQPARLGPTGICMVNSVSCTLAQ